jgi:hypothetical protein
LNFGLILIQFILAASPDWSFSRLGTHCLENFFGFVRQNARANDRKVAAHRIIARTTRVCLEMQSLKLNIAHHGRDNVGDVVIGGFPITLPGSLVMSALQLCRSFVAMAGLSFNGAAPAFDRIQLGSILENWRRKDTHHGTDSAYKAASRTVIPTPKLPLGTARLILCVRDPCSRQINHGKI